jgi:restriction endonuclease S subunit
MSRVVNFISHAAQHLRLCQIARVRGGYSFRSAIPESASSDIRAIQMKDVEALSRGDWSQVVRAALPRIPEKDSPEWIRSGDILFTFRGTRSQAFVVDHVAGRAVAATHFLIIRVRDTGAVLPAFLAWQLSQPAARAYFDRSAEGTAQRSVRRSVVEDATIALPDVDRQKTIVQLVQFAQRERELYEGLIEIREQELQGIAAALMRPT